jgi:UDP-N-acetylglucosamine--N-acetylmuramyl-(pentapeptide) pyrophosphoryl-undecaprenol N-acetylglucosamine transferase
LSDEANPVLWIGGEGGMEEELVQRQNIPFKAIPAAGVHGVGMKALPGNLWRLVKGTAAAGISSRHHPDVMLFTVGRCSTRCCCRRSIPSSCFSDIEPGMASNSWSVCQPDCLFSAELPGHTSQQKSFCYGLPHPPRAWPAGLPNGDSN